MTSTNLKPCILRTLGARELILSTAIEVGVVYLQTGNESLLVSGRGGREWSFLVEGPISCTQSGDMPLLTKWGLLSTIAI